MQNSKDWAWQCPVCDHPRYQKYGGVTVPAKKVYRDADGNETAVDTYFHAGVHFMCMGCSVFFANPRKFNKKAIKDV